MLITSLPRHHNLTDPSTISNPGPDVWRLAETGEWCTDDVGSLLGLSYRAAAAILRSKDLRPARIEVTSLGQITSGPVCDWAQRSLTFCDGEDHLRRRRHLSAHFDTTRTGPWDFNPPASGDVHDDLVAPALISSFAARIGVPADDLAEIADHVARFVTVFGYTATTAIESDLEALTAWVNARPHLIDGLDDTALAVQILAGGWETVAAQATNTVHLLCRQPWLGQIASGELDITNAVTEATRFHPAAFATLRMPDTKTVFQGFDVDDSTLCIAIISAANRDQTVYDDPHTFNPNRAFPRQPLTFGAGAHHCLGASVAHSMIVELITKIVDRWGTGFALDANQTWGSAHQPWHLVDLRYRTS